MRRGRKTRKGKGMPLWAALVILAAISAVAALWWLALHVAVAAGFVILTGGAVYAGRLWERRRTGNAPAVKSARSAGRPMPKGPDPADQIATLERLAARPIDAIIASYERIQGRYGARS